MTTACRLETIARARRGKADISSWHASQAPGVHGVAPHPHRAGAGALRRGHSRGSSRVGAGRASWAGRRTSSGTWRARSRGGCTAANVRLGPAAPDTSRIPGWSTEGSQAQPSTAVPTRCNSPAIATDIAIIACSEALRPWNRWALDSCIMPPMSSTLTDSNSSAGMCQR